MLGSQQLAASSLQTAWRRCRRPGRMGHAGHVQHAQHSQHPCHALLPPLPDHPRVGWALRLAPGATRPEAHLRTACMGVHARRMMHRLPGCHHARNIPLVPAAAMHTPRHPMGHATRAAIGRLMSCVTRLCWRSLGRQQGLPKLPGRQGTPPPTCAAIADGAPWPHKQLYNNRYDSLLFVIGMGMASAAYCLQVGRRVS